MERKPAESDALKAILTALEKFEPEVRSRLLKTASTFFGLENSSPATRIGSSSAPAQPPPHAAFSTDRSMSPKEFLLEKQPKTDVERVACLAFYLNHYREIPNFKTFDISKLNTEAAQSKFSNAGYAVDNATRQGYLAPASRGMKQLSAPGERFVQALPDREKARAQMSALRPKRRGKGKSRNSK